MTTVLDARLVPRIAALIDRLGVPAVFTAQDDNFDPSTGGTAPSGAVEHTVKATPPDAYKSHLVDGDVIKRGDARIYIAGKDLPFTPDRGMKVVVAQKTWRIVEANPVLSGNEAPAYELHLRGVG